MLNKDFIPLELNLTKAKQFPDSMPALWPWKLYHSVNPISKIGFTACITLTPDGKKEIDNAGDASSKNWKTAAYYHGEKFVEYLERSLRKFKERAK